MIPAQDTNSPEETQLRYAGWRAVLACFLMALFLFGLPFTVRASTWSNCSA